MPTKVKTIHLLVFTICLVSLSNSCFKGDGPEPFIAPADIRIEATVPEYVYTNIKVVVLDARRTLSLNGKKNLRFQWECIDFPVGGRPAFSNPKEALTLIDSLKPGTYKLRLSVSDSAGNSAVSNFGMDVLSDTLTGPPRLNVLVDTVIYLPQTVITLSAPRAYSVNPPGRDLYFLWSVIQQPAGSPPVNIHFPTGPSTNIEGYVEGNYLIRLEVTNEIGLSAADTMVLKIIGDTLAGKSKIYENLVWEELNDGWDIYYFTRIKDPGVLNNRDEKKIEVQLWDHVLQNWSPKDKYGWYLILEEIHVFNYIYSDSIKGSTTKAKVTFL